MGKGDRKTAKGKRYNSSYGNVRKAVTKASGAAAAGAGLPDSRRSAAKSSKTRASFAKPISRTFHRTRMCGSPPLATPLRAALPR